MTRLAVVLLALALLAAPLVADAQLPSMPRVGVLSPGKSPPDDAFRQRERFEAGLRELGWTPGSNVVIDYRYADGNLDRLPALAAELVRIPVNVIVARGLTIRAAREATATIPIVMAADPDPVRSGFVASLARPGGNITGLSTLAPDLEAKQLELLRAALPSLVRVGVLANANSPNTEETTRLEAATRALHFTLTESRISRSEQLAAAFAAMRQAGMGAVLFRYDLWFIDPKQVAALVGQYRLPTMHKFAAIRGGWGAGIVRGGLRLRPPPFCHVRGTKVRRLPTSPSSSPRSSSSSSTSRPPRPSASRSRSR